ncbi:MAG: ABC transporter permease [Armatimonadota bacterium]|nr:ABC transporter permease [Armatimonadota bacterium]MDW8155683.1 ABC transporter permease [Armatimonadota bacterium]
MRWSQRPLTVVGTVLVCAYALAAVLSPWVAPHDPLHMYPGLALAGPSLRFPFGTDEFGRCVFSRILHGARVSLFVAGASVATALILGTTVGLVAGLRGGRLDNVLMRVMDVVFAFPSVLLALFVVGVLGPAPAHIVVAIGLVYAPQFARVSRAAVLTVRHLEYVEAARALGASELRILRRHILPNVAAPLIVQVSLTLSLAILTESALSFLGLGTQPPWPSWGNMLSAGRRFMELAPWVAVFPGASIMGIVLGFNLLGDGLQELLDPRMRSEHT